jgi:GNAT superfamily N-acetyltransferase
MDEATGTTIRAYGPEDLEACRELWRELTQHHRDLYGNQTIGGADPGVHFDAYLKHPKRVASWVAVKDGGVVGLTGLLRDGDEAEIEPVVVAARYRGRGIGRRLLDFAIERAREDGAKSVKIRPVARNAQAMRHFHAAGFTVLGHVEMLQTLAPSRQEWKPGIDIHGLAFRQ